VRDSALQSGINDFLNKPFDFVELQARATNMLALRASQKKLAQVGGGANGITAAAQAVAGLGLERALTAWNDQLALLPDDRERQRQELEFCSAQGAALIAVKGYAAETGQVYARARELWEQLGSPSEFLHVPYGQSRYHWYRGELDLAQRLDEGPKLTVPIQAAEVPSAGRRARRASAQWPHLVSHGHGRPKPDDFHHVREVVAISDLSGNGAGDGRQGHSGAGFSHQSVLSSMLVWRPLTRSNRSSDRSEPSSSWMAI